jgi:hypothetical protein
MARSISLILEEITQEQVFILVPDVYGIDQLRIINEQTLINPDFSRRILLSQELGECLRPLLFSDGDFNQYASHYLERYPHHQALWNSLVSGQLAVTDIHGSPSTIAPGTLTLEISRNPILRSPIPYSFFTAIESQASIFEAALAEPNGIDGIDLGIVEEMLHVVEEMERGFRLHFLPSIGTLSWRQTSTRRFHDERRTPPLLPAPITMTEPLRDGVYISQSGINGLESLYYEALVLPGRIYSNRIHESIPADQIIPPHFIAHPAIEWAFARAAWNTIWLANLTSTPLICPVYKKGDHPEIFFNTRTVERIGLAAVWDSDQQSLVQFLDTLDTEDLLSKQRAAYDATLLEFGTLDGIEYCSGKIVEDYIHGC